MIAEGQHADGNNAPADAASMRPRFSDRGRGFAQVAWLGGDLASMRPRFSDRGRTVYLEGMSDADVASMRPRFSDRGRQLNAVAALLGTTELQ